MPEGFSQAAAPNHGALFPNRAKAGTLLAVEDSRYAAEALRLYCQRLGFRMRRADSLAAAQSHLKTYQPHVVLVDLGLPDGMGESLIRDLVQKRKKDMIVIGMSGREDGEATSLAAGADRFLAKPIASLDAFRTAIGLAQPVDVFGTGGFDRPPVALDDLALRDDLLFADSFMKETTSPDRHRYLFSFLKGVARMAEHQDPLGQDNQPIDDSASVDSVLGLLKRRLATARPDPFLAKPGGQGA